MTMSSLSTDLARKEQRDPSGGTSIPPGVYGLSSEAPLHPRDTSANATDSLAPVRSEAAPADRDHPHGLGLARGEGAARPADVARARRCGPRAACDRPPSPALKNTDTNSPRVFSLSPDVALPSPRLFPASPTRPSRPLHVAATRPSDAVAPRGQSGLRASGRREPGQTALCLTRDDGARKDASLALILRVSDGRLPVHLYHLPHHYRDLRLHHRQRRRQVQASNNRVRLGGAPFLHREALPGGRHDPEGASALLELLDLHGCAARAGSPRSSDGLAYQARDRHVHRPALHRPPRKAVPADGLGSEGRALSSSVPVPREVRSALPGISAGSSVRIVSAQTHASSWPGYEPAFPRRCPSHGIEARPTRRTSR